MIIVALMGKSGSGKSTIESKLDSLDYKRVISYTTRDMRDGELNHREYHFVTEDQFDTLITSGILVEWATYNGKRYGSPKPIGTERSVVVVEPIGVRKLKELYGEQVVAVYVNTPDEVIDNRLDIRNDTPDEIKEHRKVVDNALFRDATELADLVIDGTKAVNTIAADILRFITDRGINNGH